MVRVTDYFETQLHVPSMKRRLKEDQLPSVSDTHEGSDYGNDTLLPGLEGRAKDMSDEQMVGWFSKVLDSVRLRYRKLQRYVR
jgi:mitogen-activated protein kinase kinase kinase